MAETTHHDIISQLESPRREEIQQLHDLISGIVPEWEQWVTKGIMAFGRYSYYGSSKKCSGDWFYVGLGLGKAGMSVYITPSDSDLTLPEQGKGKLGTSDIGKSCIRFKSVDKLNLLELEKLLRRCKQIIDAGGTGPGGKIS